MFALTKKTDYAIIALSHMAQCPGVVCKARDIADRFHMPAALLMNVLKNLCQGELVRSTRGVKGGYALALPPDEITLDSIIQVVEGPVRFVQCAGELPAGEANCELLANCPVTRPVRKLHNRLKEFLKQVTLAQIAYDCDYGDKNVSISREGAVVRME